MHHSDRVSQYCSAAYRALEARYGMQTSMSRKGNCSGSAPMESFFGSVKNKKPAERIIFEYIKCTIIAFGVMQKLAAKYLLTSPTSITFAIRLQHISDDLPVY